MPQIVKIVLFVLSTAAITWVSRAALREPNSHGFYRFFAWETILILFLINVDAWFVDPFALRQILSWAFLITSLVLIYLGVQMFRQRGKIDSNRRDPALVGIEKTTELVTSGVYKTIRHPFYASLLFLAWGILLKQITWLGILLALTATVFLVLTARKEEVENIRYFGEIYRSYMQQTKMFIPYVF